MQILSYPIAIRCLLLHQPEYKKPEYKMKVALERYKKEKISLGRAADIAALSIEEMKEMLRSQGIPLAYVEDIDEIIEDAENAKEATR